VGHSEHKVLRADHYRVPILFLLLLLLLQVLTTIMNFEGGGRSQAAEGLAWLRLLSYLLLLLLIIMLFWYKWCDLCCCLRWHSVSCLWNNFASVVRPLSWIRASFYSFLLLFASFHLLLLLLIPLSVISLIF